MALFRGVQSHDVVQLIEKLFELGFKDVFSRSLFECFVCEGELIDRSFVCTAIFSASRP